MIRKWIFAGLASLAGVTALAAPQPISLQADLTYAASGWDQERWHTLSILAAEQQDLLLRGFKVYDYPFGRPLRLSLERQGEETVRLLAYGSLISSSSASRTLSDETLKTRRPAIAFGLKRLFNYDPTPDLSDSEIDRAMLNVEVMPSTDSIINGVVMEVPKEELKALCQREVGYDLIPVVTVLWEEAASPVATKPRFFVSYVLSAPSRPYQGRSYTNGTLQPLPRYLQLVEQAADSYGPSFYELWLQTTYLADGKTSIRDWNARG